MEGITNHPKSNDYLHAENWCLTTTKVNKLNMTWTITNFSYFFGKIGEAFKSGVFSSDSDDKRWCFRIYPSGHDEESKDYISLYVILVSFHELKVRAKFRLSLINSEGKETNTMEIPESPPSFFTNSWGFKKFIRRDLVLNEDKTLLPNNNLTIFCEVDYVNICGKTKEEIKITNCGLINHLEHLLHTQKFSDVIIIVNDQEFPAHKAILSARSPVFSAMFEHRMEEGQSNRVVITDIDNEVMHEMLHFIYTGKVNNLEKIAYELLAAADKYALERLKIMCEEVLLRNLSNENAAHILILADVHSSAQLKSETIFFITRNIKGIMETDGWKSMVKSHPHLIAEAYSTLATSLVFHPPKDVYNDFSCFKTRNSIFKGKQYEL